jgi:hypothetical protein
MNLSAFSDTIIISMHGHVRLINQPWRFVELLCKALIPAFVRSMDYDFFFRGVIAMGSLARSVSSARMIIGPAVDEAVKLSPSTRLILENGRYDKDSNLIVN